MATDAVQYLVCDALRYVRDRALDILSAETTQATGYAKQLEALHVR